MEPQINSASVSQVFKELSRESQFSDVIITLNMVVLKVTKETSCSRDIKTSAILYSPKSKICINVSSDTPYSSDMTELIHNLTPNTNLAVKIQVYQEDPKEVNPSEFLNFNIISIVKKNDIHEFQWFEYLKDYNYDKVVEMVEAGMDVDTIDDSGYWALYLMIKPPNKNYNNPESRIKIIDYLLEHGTYIHKSWLNSSKFPDSTIYYNLCMSTESDTLEITKHLVEKWGLLSKLHPDHLAIMQTLCNKHNNTIMANYISDYVSANNIIL